VIDLDFAAAQHIVKVYWDDNESRLYVLLDFADPETIGEVGRRLLPQLANRNASLAVGSRSGMRSSVRGAAVYER
jgi:hypothetical protein